MFILVLLVAMVFAIGRFTPNGREAALSYGALKALMALPRYGKDEEIASFVSYLASDEAAYITGASLAIDGGFSA